MEMHVHGSTYRKGHTLDVLLTHCMDEYLVRNVANTDMGISDHSAIKFTISAARWRAVLKVKYRKLRAINADIIRQDIHVLRLEDLESLSVDELVNHYDATLVNLVETHAPLLETNVRMRPDTAWYNDDLRDAKQESGRRERTWRKSKLEIHKQMFREQCKMLNDCYMLRLLSIPKKSGPLEKTRTKLFAAANTLLNRNKASHTRVTFQVGREHSS